MNFGWRHRGIIESRTAVQALDYFFLASGENG
jgi:hypothetical protein